jgi:hypothetical protein
VYSNKLIRHFVITSPIANPDISTSTPNFRTNFTRTVSKIFRQSKHERAIKMRQATATASIITLKDDLPKVELSGCHSLLPFGLRCG